MRWWADSGSALGALGRVDDSDVVQGVGTAVLGYHALALGALRPLAERTLVDCQTIRDALGGVDLEPVAKALGAATRPVMGDASGRYGQLLAGSLHDEATRSTALFVEQLTNTGLDWPAAVSRAADVHGVPLDRMGLPGARLRGAGRLPAAAQADWADRALVGYAAHVGNREADGPVSKSMRMGQREWDEDEVNRDRKGRFAPEAQSGVTASQERAQNYAAYRDARKKRRERRGRIVPRIGLVMDESPDAGDGAGEGRARRLRDPAAVTAGSLEAKQKARGDKHRAARRREKNAKERKARVEALLTTPPPKKPPEDVELKKPYPQEPRDVDGKFSDGVVTTVKNDYYALLPEHLAAEILTEGGFNYGKLFGTRWNMGPVMTGRELVEEIAELQDADIQMRIAGRENLNPIGRNVVVRFVGGQMAWQDGSSPNDTDDKNPASGAVFETLTRNATDHDFQGFETGATDFAWKATAAAPPVPFRSISVSLENVDDFHDRTSTDYEEPGEYEGSADPSDWDYVGDVIPRDFDFGKPLR